MRKVKNKKISVSSQVMVATLCGLTVSACSSSSTTTPEAATTTATTSAISKVAVSKLPSLSGMLATNANSSKSVAKYVKTGMLKGQDYQNFAVTGTAPLMSDLKSKIDEYFWNGLLATVKTAGSATDAQKSEFWGSVDGGAGGMGACMMADSVIQSFSQMLSAGTQLCYMKALPASSGGVTVTGGDQATMFDQGSGDKLVKISMPSQGSSSSGDSGGGGPAGESSSDADIFVKVFGTDNVTSSVYKMAFYACSNGSPMIVQTHTVDKTNASYDMNMYMNMSGTLVMKATVSSALSEDSAGNVVFDTSKDRLTSFGLDMGSAFSLKSELTINSSNQIITKLVSKFSGNTNNGYSIAEFSGDGASTTRFLQAGFKNSSSGTMGSQSYSGGTEWNSDHYVSSSTNELKTQAESIDFSTDGFYTAALDTTEDVSGYSCTATPDVTVALDITDTSLAAAMTACDGDSVPSDQLCSGTDVITAMQYSF